MDPLGAVVSMSSRVLNQRDLELSNAILDLADDPTPEAAVNLSQAQSRFEMSMGALKLGISATNDEATQFAKLMGLGQNINLLG